MNDKDISTRAVPEPIRTNFKTIKTRIVNKHDTEAHWNASDVKDGFVPKQGEIVVYDIDSTHTSERIKIGDGTTAVGSLPFIGDVTAAGDNTFTGSNKFIKGIKIGTNTMDGDSETDGFELTKSGFNMYLKNKPLALINFPNYTAAGGTLALTSDIPDASTFAKLAGNNVFTGDNSFAGSLSVASQISANEITASSRITATNFTSKFNKLKMGDNIYTFSGAGGEIALASDIVANPTVTGTETALTSIGIKGTNYKINGGSSTPIISSGVMGVGDFSGEVGTKGAYLWYDEDESLYGRLVLFDNDVHSVIVETATLTSTRSIALPDKDGIFALISDIPKLYEHIISFNAYLADDSDVNGDGNLRFTSTSSDPIIITTSADTKLLSFKTFLVSRGATSTSTAYPITFHSDGYTTMIWQGFYNNNGKIMAATGSSGSTDKGKEITVGTIVEKILGGNG